MVWNFIFYSCSSTVNAIYALQTKNPKSPLLFSKHFHYEILLDRKRQSFVNKHIQKVKEIH